MKKTAAVLLAIVLVLGMFPAYALTNEEALKLVDGYLTEVYSYTAEEAETFFTTVFWDVDHWGINFASDQHPEWVYFATYQDGASRVENVTTPFKPKVDYEYYPGEGSVREGLNRARKGGWFSTWDEASRKALQQYMAEWGIKATPTLTEGLSLGSISAGNAIHEYFISCYGDEANWSVELMQWRDAELEYYAQTMEEEIPLTDGVVRYQGMAYNGQVINAVRFINEVPEELAQVFSHPKLEGWTCLCGATVQNDSNAYGHGLAAFEKDGKRLLVALRHEAAESDWKMTPVSETALYTDRKMFILPDATGQRHLTIVYENSETETERYDVVVSSMSDGRLDAVITDYSRMDEASGNGVRFAIANAVKAVMYENHKPVREEQSFETMSNMMSMVDIEAFPKTIEEWQNEERHLIPEGYALISGVHLRQKTSSRSRDLGEYNAGVLVKVLGTEPGDPSPWYHVQAGRTEGYMSSQYVDDAASIDTAYVLSRPLPVAQAKQDIKLKSRASWLAGTVETIPAGTLMHVLAECDGGWLHVSVPQGEWNWQMDVSGVDGYIKETDVKMAGTPLMLEWME